MKTQKKEVISLEVGADSKAQTVQAQPSEDMFMVVDKVAEKESPATATTASSPEEIDMVKSAEAVQDQNK